MINPVNCCVPAPMPDIGETPNLPEFVPVEQMFPGWLTCRCVVEACIPNALLMAHHSTEATAVVLDPTWMGKLLLVTPEEDRARMVVAINNAIDSISEAAPSGMFDSFIGLPLCRDTLHKMNGVIANIDALREYKGIPTSIDILRHCLGIKRALGPATLIADAKYWPKPPPEPKEIEPT